MSKEIEIASAEVLAIIKLLDTKYVEKIPKKFIKALEVSADKNYTVDIDVNKNIMEQKISEKTKDLLVMIYRNYWCSEAERKEIDKILEINEKEYQENLRKKYDPNNIFKNNVNSNAKEYIKKSDVKLFKKK